jgi:RimJ/RimL family protein N-acetyltransferase
MGQRLYERGLPRGPVRYLFDEAGFAYAIMKAHIQNTRSRHVIEREGFHYDHDEEEDLPLKKKTVTVAVYHLDKKFRQMTSEGVRFR